MADESFGHQCSHLPGRCVKAVTRPRKENFVELKRFASWSMVFLLLALECLWSIILEVINFATMPKVTDSSGETEEAVSLGGAIGITIAVFLFSYFLGMGIFHGLAQCMAVSPHERGAQRGSPTFLQLCFLNLLYSIPLDILSILGLIPFIGWVIGLALFIYRLVLLVYTLQAVYHVSVGQAIGIIVCFVVIIIVVFVIFIFTIGLTIASILARAAS